MFIKLFYRKIHFYHLELGKVKVTKNNDCFTNYLLDGIHPD